MRNLRAVRSWKCRHIVLARDFFHIRGIHFIRIPGTPELLVGNEDSTSCKCDCDDSDDKASDPGPRCRRRVVIFTPGCSGIIHGLWLSRMSWVTLRGASNEERRDEKQSNTATLVACDQVSGVLTDAPGAGR
jgi:hypothetical protein